MSYSRTFGTIKPSPHFNAGETAQELHKAMKGLGCDKHDVIRALVSISGAQRQIAAADYNAKYDSDLVDDLKSELHNDLEEVVLGLMQTPSAYDARRLHEAVNGLGTKEHILIDVLCTRANEEMAAIKLAYQTEYGQTLDSAIEWDTSGDFEHILVALINADRDQSRNVDMHKAKEDAQKLLDEGEKSWGTDESTFSSILTTQNLFQLRAVFEEYSRIAGHGIEEAIESEFSDNAKKGYLTLIECIQNRTQYFAHRLHEAMSGIGTEDSELIRVIISRAEYDLALIRDDYMREYGTSLVDAIDSDCRGAYKDSLIAIVKGN